MTEPTTVRAPRACPLLRTKTMYVPGESGDTGFNSSTAHFWCLRTMTCLGPDRDLVSREDCIPGRGCYEVEA